jgi:superfamily II DNA or RNA helicase
MKFLVPIEAFDNFRDVKGVSEADLIPDVLETVRKLDERDEFEPFLRCILGDIESTPHGPAELVDIYTHRLCLRGEYGMGAFILKGKSFSTVRPADVAHQIYRLKKIDGLSFAVLASPGIILDPAKEQFCATCQEERLRYSIFSTLELARLFVAYGFICPRDGNLISAGRCRCGYSPQNRILNLLQREALEGLQAAHAARKRTGLVVLPTGSGKTRIAAEDASRTNAAHTLFVAHTHEILDVAVSEFTAKFGTERVVRARTKADLAKQSRVIVATIQLLNEHLNALSQTAFDYVVVDEFHHAAAPSYRRLLAHLQPGFTLGMTGTPERADGQRVEELCDNVIVASYELRFGIETGVLCPYHYYGCFDDVDYSAICHNGQRYEIRDLERALLIPRRDEAIIAKWNELALQKSTIAFCCTIKHAERVARRFREAGISSTVYTSKTNKRDRTTALAAFRAGDSKILCVVDVLNEGADLPFVECLLFLRPTESKRVFYQQLGRGLRKSPGKSQCVVIDFIGNFKNAHKIISYQGLLPFERDDEFDYLQGTRRGKELLNLPMGCKVTFDTKVIDIFARSANSFEFATRFTIERILLYQFDRLAQRLQHHPSKKELDRNCLVGSEIYETRWGSWEDFELFVHGRPIPPVAET